MTHRFDVATLKAVDVTTCKAGFYLHLGSAAARLILKIDSENPKYHFFVQLDGDTKFKTTFSDTPHANRLFLIPLDMTSAKLELPDNPDRVSNPESLGAILVCKDGAYLITNRITERGEVDVEYVSLQSFKTQNELPADRYGIFTTWRLTTSEANPSERTVLVSNGEWPQ